MVSTETGKIGIISRAHESVTAPRIRYSQARQALRAHLGDIRRDRRPLAAARDLLEQRSDDMSLSDFNREDARLSLDVLDSFDRMANQLGGYSFAPAPARQPKLRLAGVEVSVNLDLLVTRTRGSVEQVGGALFRFTQAEDETPAATARRREMGQYAATLVQMHVQRNLAGNRQPNYQLCLSVDVQFEEVHMAPRTYAQRAQNLENACRFIAAMWGRV